MVSLKKYSSLKASSILESVIALTIISVCLCITIMVLASVFTQKTSLKFYDTQNKVNELFFLAQLQGDSLLDATDENFNIEEENINATIKKMHVSYKDSSDVKFERSFFIQVP